MENSNSNNNGLLKLIPVFRDDLLEKYGIPYTQKTLRVWHSKAKNKELFVKLDRRLYIVYAEWLKFVERNYQEGIARRGVDDILKSA